MNIFWEFYRAENFLVCAVFFLAATSELAAKSSREFYVSPVGDDTHPGTKSKPFLTLAHTRDAVRVVSGGMTGDIVVNLRGGNYPLISPLEFGAADSGRNGFNII